MIETEIKMLDIPEEPAIGSVWKNDEADTMWSHFPDGWVKWDRDGSWWNEDITYSWRQVFLSNAPLREVAPKRPEAGDRLLSMSDYGRCVAGTVVYDPLYAARKARHDTWFVTGQQGRFTDEQVQNLFYTGSRVLTVN